MISNLSAKYYKKNKAKKKGIKIFLKKKEKNNIIVMKDTKTFLNMENKG